MEVILSSFWWAPNNKNPSFEIANLSSVVMEAKSHYFQDRGSTIAEEEKKFPSIFEWIMGNYI